MRKRVKGQFICRACGSQIIPENLEIDESPKKTYVRIFGRLMQIQECEIKNYVGFKIEYR